MKDFGRDFTGMIGKLRTGETVTLAIQALDALPKEDAWTVIKDWIKDNDLVEEAASWVTEDE